MLLFALSAWRFRGTCMTVIVHAAQSLLFALLTLGVILGWLRAATDTIGARR